MHSRAGGGGRDPACHPPPVELLNNDAIHLEPERIRLEAELNKLVKKLLEEPLGDGDEAASPSSAVRRA